MLTAIGAAQFAICTATNIHSAKIRKLAKGVFRKKEAFIISVGCALSMVILLITALLLPLGVSTILYILAAAGFALTPMTFTSEDVAPS